MGEGICRKGVDGCGGSIGWMKREHEVTCDGVGRVETRHALL